MNKIREIIKKLLDIHRSKVNTLEEVDVNEVITSTLSLLEDQLFINKIEVKTELSNKPGFIKALTQELFQVFMNLILNAMDAMEDGGILRICSTVKNDKLEINFIDNGSGISEKDIDHIFEPFYTTKSEMLGTGLGLSTSKGIVESFKGEIFMESKKEKGATFKLIFPLSK